MDMVTSYLVFGTGFGFVHCEMFCILYMSHYIGLLSCITGVD